MKITRCDKREGVITFTSGQWNCAGCLRYTVFN